MADRAAIVTGVSKGLGESLAANLLDRGFAVVGIGRSAAKRLDSPAFRLVTADLADVAALPAIVDPLFAALAASRYASIVLINNAAFAGPAGTVGDLSPEETGSSLAVNLVAPTLVANAFIRAFRDASGDRRVINVSSGAAAGPIAGGGVYSIAKAGLEMLTMTIAAEQAQGGIVAITIRPGVIDTAMQVQMRSQPATKLPSVAMFRQLHASGQLVPPDVTAAKIVDRLVLGTVEPGRVYRYQEL
jgi:NAD(P)-dependent dehydrogenase (short-subunit alcohol dehydrogenase family)